MSCLGLIIDRDYQKTATAAGFTVNRTKGDDLSDFPIEKARLRSIWYFMGLSMACTLGYGWSVERKIVSFVPGISILNLGKTHRPPRTWPSL